MSEPDPADGHISVVDDAAWDEFKVQLSRLLAIPPAMGRLLSSPSVRELPPDCT
jgi:hypothetical protein